MLARQLLAALLILLLASPAWTDFVAIGTTVGSQSATIRNSPLTPGTTIFSGDMIEVGQRGNARIALTGGGVVHVA